MTRPKASDIISDPVLGAAIDAADDEHERQARDHDPKDPTTWARTLAYPSGLVYVLACTRSDDVDEIEADANMQIPTGISSRWSMARDEAGVYEQFSDGTANPCPCPDDEARWHYLLSC